MSYEIWVTNGPGREVRETTLVRLDHPDYARLTSGRRLKAAFEASTPASAQVTYGVYLKALAFATRPHQR